MLKLVYLAFLTLLCVFFSKQTQWCYNARLFLGCYLKVIAMFRSLLLYTVQRAGVKNKVLCNSMELSPQPTSSIGHTSFLHIYSMQLSLLRIHPTVLFASYHHTMQPFRFYVIWGDWQGASRDQDCCWCTHWLSPVIFWLQDSLSNDWTDYEPMGLWAQTRKKPLPSNYQSPCPHCSQPFCMFFHGVLLVNIEGIVRHFGKFANTFS